MDFLLAMHMSMIPWICSLLEMLTTLTDRYYCPKNEPHSSLCRKSRAGNSMSFISLKPETLLQFHIADKLDVIHICRLWLCFLYILCNLLVFE